MSLTPDFRLAELALDTIEQAEAKGLVWGLVDGALSDGELTHHLREVLDKVEGHHLTSHPDCTITTARDLCDFLVAKRMLFLVPNFGVEGEFWRSRMAEGVRLLARLRQLFPRHERGTAWTSAATLVADFRFLWRPRRYPLRDMRPQEALAAIGTNVGDPQLLNAVNHWMKGLSADGRLSKFQVDATIRILGGLVSGVRRGTLVSAGTGSGKTLSFYIPALSWLAHQRKSFPTSRGVRVLALYPRNELLKDQLGEVFSQCRKFDDLLTRHGAPPLRVGVLYGDTPQTENSVFTSSSGATWRGSHALKICPFFRCQNGDCGGDMGLRQPDTQQNLHRLVCVRCGSIVDSQTLAFTRKDMEDNPPDVLFTSVEMVNQNLANSRLRHLFGIGPRAQRAPDLVLLDEVHLYTGTYGAQVAFLLRRWWALTARKSSFVGLSATLSEARTFFANLTGLDESAVEVITPSEAEMTDEGGEYLLALRGDPVSQTALLSTSIQSLMLLSRLLDPKLNFDFNRQPFNGWRAFAFTDQLDATNRLFNNLQDAEGCYSNGNRNLRRHPDGPLARLRREIDPPGDRYQQGQDWRAVSEIGHDLSGSGYMKVGRTTSFDTGVSTQSQIVIATAALEVGFDDPAVGVVLQHKAPRDNAQFLQRKGRAGRTRHMRPWTVVVLSDYGRDRQAYQGYDQLFDPQLPARRLPMSNRYVQRMQAVYALIDELGQRMQSNPIEGSVWRDLKGPLPDRVPDGWTQAQFDSVKRLANEVAVLTDDQWRELARRAVTAGPRDSKQMWSGKNWLGAKIRRIQLHNLLSEILKDPSATDVWTAKIGQLLGLSRDEMEPLLWAQPRPVFLGAVPTAIRRLSTNWRSHFNDDGDHQAGHPLPDFMPANLFSDLNLPEMRIDIPDVRGGDFESFMPVQQGLAEFAPGRVSMRFDKPLWLGVDSNKLTEILASGQTLIETDEQLNQWYQLDGIGHFHRLENGLSTIHKAFRPIAALPILTSTWQTQGATRVADTSNAQLIWTTQLLAMRSGAKLIAPPSVGISKVIVAVTVHTHATQSEVHACRYAVGSRADLRIQRGNSSERVTVVWRFKDGDEFCGVGFEMESDAVVFELQMPEALHSSIDWSDATRVRAARAARYSWEAQHGNVLATVVQNSFLRTWLAQIFQTATVMVCHRVTCTLRTAMDQLADGQHGDTLVDVMQSVFQAANSDDEDDHEGSDRLRQTINENLANREVLKALREVACALVDPIDATWDAWLSTTVRTTLGAAILEAVQQACPEVDGDSLIVDIDPGLDEMGRIRPVHQIWVSEVNPGGNGLIEQLAEVLFTQPENFYRHVEVALAPQEFEIIDRQLRDVVQSLGGATPDQDLIESFTRVRMASSSVHARQEFGQLRAKLTSGGQSVFHGYAVALSLRLLRQRSPIELDQLIAEIQSKWDQLESAHGIEVDVRLVCAFFSGDSRLDLALENAGFSIPADDRRSWRFGVLMGILWARGHALRSTVLPLPNRYAGTPYASERLLIGQWLTPHEDPIDLNNPNWIQEFKDRLVANSRVTVVTSSVLAGTRIPKLVLEAITEPIQFDYLNVYAKLASIKRSGGDVEWTFEIPENI
jgi:hypothetical protein